MKMFAIPFVVLLLLAVGFYSSSRNNVVAAADSASSGSRHLWIIIAALACIPAGFGLPFFLGLQGLMAWPWAIGVWGAGAGISTASLPQAGPTRSWLLFACWSNLVLIVFFGALFLIAALVSR